MQALIIVFLYLVLFSETAQRDAARQKLEMEINELKKEKVPLYHSVPVSLHL